MKRKKVNYRARRCKFIRYGNDMMEKKIIKIHGTVMELFRSWINPHCHSSFQLNERKIVKWYELITLI